MKHRYAAAVEWTGNTGQGTAGYRSYLRDHTVTAEGKETAISGSSDPAFRGDAKRYNPEELLVASLSACHMLWYLHICADSGVVVEQYRDEAFGEMRENDDGSGEFIRVVLRPRVVIRGGSEDKALALHEEAHAKCFIARSVKFPVLAEPEVVRLG